MEAIQGGATFTAYTPSTSQILADTSLNATSGTPISESDLEHNPTEVNLTFYKLKTSIPNIKKNSYKMYYLIASLLPPWTCVMDILYCIVY